MISAERQTGKRPERLDGPPIPPELAYLWRWFSDIHAGRTVNGMAPNRASYLDILAWQILTSRVLAPWELRAIMLLGSAWVGVQVEKTAGITPPSPTNCK